MLLYGPIQSHIQCLGCCSSIIIIIIINHPSSPWSCAVFRFGVIMMYMIHDFSLFRTNTHTQHSAKDAMLQHNGFGMENL